MNNESCIRYFSRSKLIVFVALVFTLIMLPAQAQDSGDVNKVSIEISCDNADGDEVNSGLGNLTVGDDPTILLKDDTTAAACAGLGAQLLLSQLDDDMIAELISNLGIDVDLGGGDTGGSGDSDDTGGNAVPLINIGTPIDPADNLVRECDNREATNNGVRIQAFLPSGSYRVVLVPAKFQNFDPILFVDSGDERICSSESNLAREYVMDFSRIGVGGQIYGHNSGGVLEFDVSGSSTDLSPVDIIVGGQDRSDAGTSGEFVLIIEGARLSPQANQHVYAVSMSESLFSSDTPLAVITMGIDEVTDPHLTAGVFSGNEFITLFECEDAGAECDSDNRFDSLEGSSVVEAAVRTVSGDDLDAAIVKQPGAYLAQGVQNVSFIVSEVQDDTLSREEYVIVFYGGID